MMIAGWLSRPTDQQLSAVRLHRNVGGIVAAIVLMMTSAAVAQNPTASAPLTSPEEKMAVPVGYKSHQSIDVGGHLVNKVGSGAMYDTLVNQQSGPRVLGGSFEMRALPGAKNNLVDTLSLIGSGFGGDPYNFAKLNASKGKEFDFSGLFRRDRQYFDYDLLGNPNIPTGLSIPIGPSNAPTGSFAWPQVQQSPVMFNTVRRMTDTTLTILPLSAVSFRVGYSQDVFEGPSLSPGASSNFFDESIGAYDQLLQQYQRDSTDEFIGAIDWKPVHGTQLTFEEEINHFKADTFFTLAPSAFTAQEADGTPVAIGNWDSQAPYGIGACNKGSMGSGYVSATNYTIFSPSQNNSSLPIINAACDVASSYLRSQPTRILFPTEIFRIQSSSIKNLAMNGDVRFTNANMNLPNYYENYQGLDGAVRSITYTGAANAKRQVLAADFGIIFQASNKFSIAEQIDYSSAHQPGTSNIAAGITETIPAAAIAAGAETINYSGPLKPGVAPNVEGSPNGTPLPGYFGQSFLTNNLTGTWDAAARATFSLTYRYGTHIIAQGSPHNVPLDVGATTDGTVTIHENGGIFNAALRPSKNWSLNGTVEVLYADNAFTPIGPRQTRHYRIHTKYRPKPWMTFTGAFNDLERHNNTNNNQSAVAAGDDPYEGPINHVDHTRIVSVGADLMPNEHFGLDINYAYSDVYAATNICYDNGATPTLPGTASTTSSGAPNVCQGIFARGSTTQLADWFARDFMDAPSQFASASLVLSPVKRIHSRIGYNISSVNGSQFFNDARGVNGSLVSTYQSPFASLAWTIRHGLIWKGEYNFYGYGEGGPSGPQFCSTSTSNTSAVVPCTSLSYPTGLTEPPSGLTAPRNFHANNLTLSMHYEF